MLFMLCSIPVTKVATNTAATVHCVTATTPPSCKPYEITHRAALFPIPNGQCERKSTYQGRDREWLEYCVSILSHMVPISLLVCL